MENFSALESVRGYTTNEVGVDLTSEGIDLWMIGEQYRKYIEVLISFQINSLRQKLIQRITENKKNLRKEIHLPHIKTDIGFLNKDAAEIADSYIKVILEKIKKVNQDNEPINYEFFYDLHVLYGLEIADIGPLILPLINNWIIRVDNDFKDLYIRGKVIKI